MKDTKCVKIESCGCDYCKNLETEKTILEEKIEEHVCDDKSFDGWAWGIITVFAAYFLFALIFAWSPFSRYNAVVMEETTLKSFSDKGDTFSMTLYPGASLFIDWCSGDDATIRRIKFDVGDRTKVIEIPGTNIWIRTDKIAGSFTSKC